MSLVSSSPATQWNFNLGAAATKVISFVSVSDSNASGSDAAKKPILPTSSTDGGNNIAWFGFVISGTVYSDEATSLIGNGAVIRLLMNGVSQGSSTTAGGTGTYSITVPSLSSGDAMLVYIDGFATKSSTATVSSGADLSGLNIYGGHLIVRHDNAGSVSNANIKAAKGVYVDSDIEYSVDASNNITVSGGTVLYLPAGKSYTPGANITTPAMKSLGTFNGGSGSITVNGALIQNGGVFTATSGTTSIAGDFTISSGTFTHNSGTITLIGTTARTINTGGAILNHLTINATTSNAAITVAGTVTVAGNLVLSNYATISGGTIAVAGNVTTTATPINFPSTGTLLINGSGAQLLGASGGTGTIPGLTINKPSGTLMLQDTLVVLGSAGWNWTAGTVNAGTSTVDFSAISGQGLAMTVNAGSMAFNNVTLNMGPWDLTVTGTMTVNGNLAINSVGYFTGGTVAVAGNVSAIDPSGASSSVTLLLNGAGAQTFSAGGGTGNMGGSVSINKPSGTLTLQDTLNIGGGWSWTAGSVIAGTSNVVFSGPSAKTVNSGAMVFNNVAVNIAPWDMTVTGIMEVAGNLIITSVTSISGGTINVGGDLISTDVAVSGNVAITLNGSGAQSITATGADLPNGLLTVNKASGTATLASNLILNSSGQDLTITQGKLDLAGYNVTFTAAGDVLTVDANGTLQLQGGETITATTKTFNAGSTVIYNGAISYGSLALGNTYSNLVFNNGTGSWSHTGVLTTNNLTITAGTLSSGGQNINVAGNWSNSGTYAAGSNTVTFTGTNQSLSGNTIFNSLTKSVATARTLTFSAGSTTTINGTATLNGASGQPLTLASSSPGTHWNLNLTAAATKALSFVSVAWGDASSSNASQKNINPASSTDGGNNIAWFGFIVSGTVYIDEATTLIGNGAVIRLLVNGASQGTSTTVGGTGTYSINVPSLSGGDAMLVYIDGFATKGSTATVSNGANLSGLNIYGGHLIARHDNGGSLSNANMKAAKGAYVDADIDYSVDAGNNLTVSGSGTELYIANGHSYTPGAVVTTPALENIGVFDGGAAAININGRLTISGGSFTHTSGTTTINGDYEFTGGTVISNNGTVTFYSTGTNWTITGSHTLANIKFDNNSGNNRIWTITGGTEITATGTVTFDNTSSFGTNINTGIINAKGDIVVSDSNNYGGTATLKINGTGNQSFSGSATQISGALPNIEINKPSGTLTVAGTLRNLNNSWTYNTGALSVTGSTIVFSQNGTLTGSHSLNNAVFSNDNTGGRTWSISSGTQLTVTGTLTFDSSSTGTMGIGTGIINAQGDILVADGNSYGGTATLIINGAGNQLFTGSATRTNGDLPNIEINKSSGTLTIAGTLRNEENSWTYVAGTLSATGSTVIFANSIGTGSLVGTHSLDNVIFDNNGGNWRTWNLGAGTVLTIAGVLTIDSSNPTYGLILNNGTLNALGDVVIGGPANGGTTTLLFSGTALQNFNLTGAATELDLDVLVNKSGGRVNLLSPLSMDANNQDLIIQTGMFDLNGNNLVVNGIGSTFVVQSGGALQLQGGETITLPTLNTGSTVIYNGGGSYGSLAVGNSYSNLTFSNATGSWTHTAPLNVGQNLTITAGTLNSTGQNITLAGNWSNSGTYTPGANTVALTGTGQNISGSTTFNNLTKDVINADTLTFSNGTTQSISGVLVMAGRSGNILNLRSATPGSQWNLNVSGSSSVSHVDVDDSNASSGNTIYAYSSSDDTVPSNNNNWVFQSLQLVKQVWTADGSLCLASIPADSNCNSNATSIVVPTSSTVTFLIFIRNVIAVAVTDVRFQDLLDDTAFTYQVGSLFRSANNAGAPSDNANLATIMAAASIAQTDNYDGDTQVDEFTGINTVASPDDLQVGGAGGVAQNDSLTIPANKTFAVKFKALKN